MDTRLGAGWLTGALECVLEGAGRMEAMAGLRLRLFALSYTHCKAGWMGKDWLGMRDDWVESLALSERKSPPRRGICPSIQTDVSIIALIDLAFTMCIHNLLQHT